MPNKTQRPLGEDERERVDAIRRLRENTQRKQNVLDEINAEYQRKRDGLSDRNRSIFD